MRKDWEIKRLGEICEIFNGLWKGKKPPFTEVGVIRNTNFTKEGYLDDSDIAYLPVEIKQYEKRKLEYGDIILEKSGGGPKQPVGRVVLFEKKGGEFSFSNFTSTIRIIDNDLLDYNFLHRYLYFQYISGNTEPMQRQSTGIRNLQLNEYKEILVPIPPISEQQRIVSILDNAFAAIAKAKANAAQNLKNAKELFESYLQGVFDKKGEGWEERRFDEICVLQRGFDLPTRLRNDGGFPLVSSSGKTDMIDLWKVKAPGVVTGRSGSIGNVHFIEEDFWPLNTALYIKEFHGNYEKCIYYFLKQFNLNKYSSGAGVPTLNRNNVHCEMVWFPTSRIEQQTMAQILDVLYDETKKLETIYQQKIEDLEELRKKLLQKAFNGEL